MSECLRRGHFSDRVQNVCNIFPASHVTILLRNAMLNGTLENIDRNIGGIDEGAFVGLIRDIFTFRDNMLFIKAFSLVFWRFCVTMIFVSLADGGFKL